MNSKKILGILLFSIVFLSILKAGENRGIYLEAAQATIWSEYDTDYIDKYGFPVNKVRCKAAYVGILGVIGYRINLNNSVEVRFGHASDNKAKCGDVKTYYDSDWNKKEYFVTRYTYKATVRPVMLTYNYEGSSDGKTFLGVNASAGMFLTETEVGGSKENQNDFVLGAGIFLRRNFASWFYGKAAFDFLFQRGSGTHMGLSFGLGCSY